MPVLHAGLSSLAATPAAGPEPERRLEDLTQRYGRDLFARLDGDKPLVFTPRWLDDQIMAWSMDEELVKVQLFRFIDVLPSLLGSTPNIVRHVKEYFGLAKQQTARRRTLGPGCAARPRRACQPRRKGHNDQRHPPGPPLHRRQQRARRLFTPSSPFDENAAALPSTSSAKRSSLRPRPTITRDSTSTSSMA